MKSKFSITVAAILFFSSQLLAVPSKLDVSRRGKGPDGYNIVNQQWIGDDHGKVVCRDPGYEECVWVEFGVNIDLLTTTVFELNTNGGASSGTIVFEGRTIQYLITNNFHDGNGDVTFLFLD
jgi:hypothetical protein